LKDNLIFPLKYFSAVKYVLDPYFEKAYVRSILRYLAENKFTSLLRRLMVAFAWHLTVSFFSFYCHNVNKLIFNNGFSFFDVAHKVHIEVFWEMVMFSIVDSGMYSGTARTSTKHGKTRAIVVAVVAE